MSKKVHYPGSTGRCAPAGVVNGIKLCDERSCDRIDIHYSGKRGGTYMTSLIADEAVTLIIKLEAEVRRLAAKKGYTDPALVRLIESRRG